MRDALLAEPPGTAWVVATGALTNVALLFAAFPDLVAHVAGLSIMGGAVGGGFTPGGLGPWRKGAREQRGNITEWAEFNIYVRDPLSLPPSRVSLMQSGTPTTLLLFGPVEADK